MCGDMEKLEKVIKGMECCVGYGIEDTPGCEDCPYNDMGDTCERVRPLYEDALALLKAQEPRVMDVDAVPVEWLREKMREPQMTDGNPFGFVLAEWLDEQEAR